MPDKLSTPLQESILCLLATDNKQGRVAAGLLSANLFDDNYKDIAARVIEYHRTQGKAPGDVHMVDLLDDILGDPEHKKHKQYLRILDNILAQSKGLNAAYLLTRINEFIDKQKLKAALIEAGERYTQGNENVVEDIRDIMFRTFRGQDQGLTAGVFLNRKDDALKFLEEKPQPYKTGIPELDRVNMGPTPKKMFLFLAPKGKGKSWMAVNLMKRCLMQGARGVHITLEMPDSEVVQRYYQSYFALPLHPGEYDTTAFDLDELGRVVGFNKDKHSPTMFMDHTKIRSYLSKKIDEWGTRIGRLVVKEFPTSYLTVPKLDAYLDFLELTEGFIPNVIAIDYPDLMQMKGDDLRVAMGTTYKDLRGLFQRRHLAGICPTQTSRMGWDARTVKASMVGEDATKIMTADMSATYSQTEAEKELGLARIGVAHNRGDEDGFNILIAQNYKAGQFCIASHRMPKNYFDLLGTQEPADDGE